MNNTTMCVMILINNPSAKFIYCDRLQQPLQLQAQILFYFHSVMVSHSNHSNCCRNSNDWN